MVFERQNAVSDEYITINGVLYRRVESLTEIFDGKTCPLCGSNNLIEHPECERFYARRGCLDCDTWLESVRLKEKR